MTNGYQLDLVVVVAVCLAVTPALAQDTVERCGTMEALAEQTRADPSIALRLVEAEVAIQQGFAASRRSAAEPTIFRIPVVVHVLFRVEQENIAEASVVSQITVLNEDFRRASGTPGGNSHGFGADSLVQFQLAQIDPNGNPSSGIVRKETDKAFFSKAGDGAKYERLGGSDAWDTSRYLNIWVCNLRGALGYAQFPGLKRPDTDGVVIDYRSFGLASPRARYDRGRTATHEVGHWLSLFHPFSETDGVCADADYVDDTPACHGANYGHNEGVICCGFRRMVENYMDYTDDQFMTTFTRGQVARMHACLDDLRAGLFVGPPFLSRVVPLRFDDVANTQFSLLVLGLDASGTPGVDFLLGDLRVDASDARGLAAWFSDPSTPDVVMLTDMRAPADEVVWNVGFTGSPPDRFRVSWDLSEIPEGSFSFAVLSPGSPTVDVDMRRVPRLSLPPQAKSLRITMRRTRPDVDAQAAVELRTRVRQLEDANRALAEQVRVAGEAALAQVRAEFEMLRDQNSDLQERVRAAEMLQGRLEQLGRENERLILESQSLHQAVRMAEENRGLLERVGRENEDLRRRILEIESRFQRR